MSKDPAPGRLTISEAREHLASIVLRVQDPTDACVLTRHGKPVAAIVSMASLARIRRDEDAERWADPRHRPLGSVKGLDGREATTDREAAEIVREVQLARWQERRVLERQGMTPLAGGELLVDAVVPVEREVVAVEPAPEAVAKRRGWWRLGRT